MSVILRKDKRQSNATGTVMFCKNCNNQIPDSSRFCPECGTKIIEEEVLAKAEVVTEAEVVAETEVVAEAEIVTEAEVVAEAEVVTGEEVLAEAEVTNEAPVETESEVTAESPVSAEKGKFDFGRIFTVVKESFKKYTKFWIGGAAVILALIIVFNLSAISGFCVKLFGDEKTYVQYVEEKAANDIVETGNTFYGRLLDIIDMNYGAETEIELNLSKDAIKSLEDATDMQFDWLDKLGMFMSTDVKNEIYSAELGVTIGSNDLINLKTILDLAGKKMFVGLPGLSDKYLSSSNVELPEGFSLKMIADIAKALPSEAKFEKLLDKYIKIIIDQFDDVSEDKDTISAGDIEQKVTVSKIKIKEETVLNIGIAILEEAKGDKELKNVIIDFVKTVKKQDALKEQFDDFTADEAYDEFVASINSGLDSLQAQKDAIGENKTFFILVNYIDADHKIVGREIKVSGESMENETVISYIMPHKGNKFAYRLEADGIKITGEGKDKDGVITGEFKILAESEGLSLNLCTIEVDKFDTNALTKGEIKGTVTILPNNRLGSLTLTDSVSNVLTAIIGDGIEFVFDGGIDKGKVEINILQKDGFYAGVTMKYKMGKGSNVKLPSEKKTYGEDEIEEFLASLDFEKIVKALEKGKVDSDIIEKVELFIETIKGETYPAGSLLF